MAARSTQQERGDAAWAPGRNQREGTRCSAVSVFNGGDAAAIGHARAQGCAARGGVVIARTPRHPC